MPRFRRCPSRSAASRACFCCPRARCLPTRRGCCPAPETDEIFDALFKGSELLLVDSPPVLPITDAAVLAQRVDATIVVVTLGTTTKRELSEAVDALARVNAPLAGTVIVGRKSGRARRSRYSSLTSAGERPTFRRPVTT